MKIIKEIEISNAYGIEYNTLHYKRKNSPEQYELIRLGAICKKYDITEETIKTIIEQKDLLTLLQNPKLKKMISIFSEE